MIIEKLQHSISSLEKYIVVNNFRGYDPYDFIESPFFKSLPHKIQFVIQQLGRRFPLNLRPLLLINKGYNPVSLGLSIQAYSYLYALSGNKNTNYLDSISLLINALLKIQSSGYHGICWGYDFHWAARYTKIDAFSPNIVATGIIINALFQSYQIIKKIELKDIIIQSAKFVELDLNRSIIDDTICFSYSPQDNQKVFNASMKAVRLLSQTYFLTGNGEYKKLAQRAVEYVVANQNRNGSWVYASGDARNWIDNYHTGYILDCLDEYVTLTSDTAFAKSLERGFAYYQDTFFYKGFIPKFRSNVVYPLDSTGIAQSILSLTRFNDFDKAMDVAIFAIDEMQGSDGHFYFRHYKYFKNKISYMRWSNTWMFAALSYLAWRMPDANQI